MMTKKRNTAVYIFLVLLIFVPLSRLSGTDSWTIAAEKFTFAKERAVTKSESAVAELLPQLILEQLAENLERIPSSQEQLDKKQYDLQKNRLDFFLQLSKEIQTRDSLVIGDYTDKELLKQLKNEDEKIAAIKKQLADNLAQESEYRKNAAPDIAREEERAKNIEAGKVFDDGNIPDSEKNDAARFKDILEGFVSGHRQKQNSTAVKLYKDDVTQLFDAGDTAKIAGYDSREFEDAVIAAGVNALVRGRLTIYGGYVAATVSLVVYPGVRTVGTVTDVNSISDFRALAVSIARQLTPKITNSMPVELVFDIKPEEAVENVVLTIDDVVYKVIPDHLIVQSGVHSVMLSSPGFKQVSTSYAFRGSRQFNISVGMIPDNSGALLLRLKKPLMGTMYANGSKTGTVDEEYPVTKIAINNQPVLGQFITEDGMPVSFYIPLKLVQDGTSLTVNAKPFDRSKYIDIRRRWMYGSYSALIISLLSTFYSYGTFHAEMLAYGDGYVSYEDAAGWQRAAQVCTGVSIGCGVFFSYELVRYFLAADKVLPDRAYPSEYEDREIPSSEQNVLGGPEIQKNPLPDDGTGYNSETKNNGVQ
ncbi:MAG: hypothetical protein WCR31_02945 [Treponema sp.]